MISVVVYGRNDDYGYNLHKRAAISLNCLAEMLGDPDDELIFVDYNSADDVPTFPEAIADTFTPEVRKKLRILRVRPHIHRRFQARTHLATVEPVARNVGVRRSNPANRWILSTNTDIVVVPRLLADLTGVASSLAPGLYHTARFEIPESLWESFDRSHPRGTIEEIRSLGRSARLNEIVYGSEVIIYDGPGDFQLMQRSDLFEIDGFDENMLLGWHVDSNIAKRLSLKYGRVTSLIDQVYCYHCDHTRQATAAHSGAYLTDNSRRFVDGIDRPDLPEQRTVWGCADDEIEEIRLSQNHMRFYRTMVESIVTPLADEFSESFYKTSTFDSYQYDPGNLLPFLADLLICYPQGARLAWCGTRRDTFELVRQVWRRRGFRRPIAVDAAVAAYLCSGDDELVEIVPRTAWLADADLSAFEFGRASDGAGVAPPASDRAWNGHDDEGISIVHSAFLAAVADEKGRRLDDAGAPLRRFIGINCINNRSEGVFATHIAAPLTPFGTHLRHGFLARAAQDHAPDLALRLALGRALGRTAPVGKDEFAETRDLFSRLLDGVPLADDQARRAAANATIGKAFLAVAASQENGASLPQRLQDGIAALDALRPSRRLADELNLPIEEQIRATAAERPLSRFAAWEDSDDPLWARFAHLFLADAEAESSYRRSAARWERIHLLYGLDRAGALHGGARVLIAASLPDALIAAVSQRVARLDLFDVADVPPPARCSPRGFWCDGAAYNPQAIRPLSMEADIEQLDAAAYDAVVFPHGAMFGAGIWSALAWMRAAERLLRPGGVLAFKTEIAAGDRLHSDFLDGGMLTGDGLPAQLSECTQLSVEGGFERRLSRATVDRIQPDSSPDASEGVFLSRSDGRVLIPGVWFLTKHERAHRSEWDSVQRWMWTPRFGEQLPALHVGAAGRRDPAGTISALPGEEGHVFYGPYLPGPAGRYRAVLGLTATRAIGRRKTSWPILEAVADGDSIAAREIDRASIRSGAVVLDFDIAAVSGRTTPHRLEFRLYSPGGLALTCARLDIQWQEPAAIMPWPRLPASGMRCRFGERDIVEDTSPPMLEFVTAVSGPAADTPPIASARPDDAPAERDLPIERTCANKSFRIVEMDHGSPELGFPSLDQASATSRPLSRLAAVEDWQDTEWVRFLDPLPDLPTASTLPDPGLWERSQLLFGLQRLGKLTGASRVLAAVTMPDQVVAVISELVGRIEVLDLGEGSERRGPEARLHWSNGALYARDRLVVHGAGTGLENLDREAYDVVAFPHCSLFRDGVTGMAGLLAKAEPLLAEGGLLVFKSEVLAGNEPDLKHLDAGFIGQGGLAACVEEMTGFVIDGGFDARLSSDTAQNLPPNGHLLQRLGGRIAVPGLWFLTRRTHTPDGGWRRLRDWQLRRLLGEQMHRLAVGPAGRRDELGRIATNGSQKGVVFFGPYIGLPNGRYEAVIGVEASAAAKRGRFVIEAIGGATVLASREVRPTAGAAVAVRLAFAISLPDEDEVQAVEFRVRSEGGAATFTECRLAEAAG